MARLKSVALAEITVTSPFPRCIYIAICTTSGEKVPGQPKFSPLNGAQPTMAAETLAEMAMLFATSAPPDLWDELYLQEIALIELSEPSRMNYKNKEEYFEYVDLWNAWRYACAFGRADNEHKTTGSTHFSDNDNNKAPKNNLDEVNDTDTTNKFKRDDANKVPAPTDSSEEQHCSKTTTNGYTTTNVDNKDTNDSKDTDKEATTATQTYGHKDKDASNTSDSRADGKIKDVDDNDEDDDDDKTALLARFRVHNLRRKIVKNPPPAPNINASAAIKTADPTKPNIKTIADDDPRSSTEALHPDAFCSSDRTNTNKQSADVAADAVADTVDEGKQPSQHNPPKQQPPNTHLMTPTACFS